MSDSVEGATDFPGSAALGAPSGLAALIGRFLAAVRAARGSEGSLPTVSFFPDYSRGDPYQRLLYGAVPGFVARPGTLAVARRRLRRSRGRDRIFHLHWTAPILGQTRDPGVAGRRMRGFLAELTAFRAEGGYVVWTVHNLLPHECPLVEAEVEFRSRLCAAVDFVHVHSPRVPELVARHYAIPAEKTLVGRHGGYRGAYPGGGDRAEARRRFGFAEDATVLLFIGMLRAYKGLDRLVAAYREVKRRHPGLALLVGGKRFRMSRAGVAALRRAAPDIRFVDRRIRDDELRHFFAAADVTVLPYAAVLTSGAAHLSMSFGTPVIAPRIGSLPDVVTDGMDGLLYPDGDRRHLELAIERYLGLGPAGRACLARGAARKAAESDWKEAGTALSAAFSAATRNDGSERSDRVPLVAFPPLSVRAAERPGLRARIEWWRPAGGGENFGDFLSLLLWESLSDGGATAPTIHHLLGSVIEARRIRRESSSLGRSRRCRIVFWGCGCRSGRRIGEATLRRVAIHGVRGPLSRDVLRLSPETPIGDPALLLPLVHSLSTDPRTEGRAVVVPHVNDATPPGRLRRLTGADVVLSPRIDGTREALVATIDAIGSARFVLAGSLHAAIVACAYDVPFCFFDAGHRDVPFKWDDFSASVNVESRFAANVEEGQAMHRGEWSPRLVKPALAPILACAPFAVRAEILERARVHRWTRRAAAGGS